MGCYAQGEGTKGDLPPQRTETPKVSLNFYKALEAWNLIKKIAPKRPGVVSPFVNEWPGYETSSYSNIDKNLLVVPCKA